MEASADIVSETTSSKLDVSLRVDSDSAEKTVSEDFLGRPRFLTIFNSADSVDSANSAGKASLFGVSGKETSLSASIAVVTSETGAGIAAGVSFFAGMGVFSESVFPKDSGLEEDIGLAGDSGFFVTLGTAASTDSTAGMDFSSATGTSAAEATFFLTGFAAGTFRAVLAAVV